MDIDARRDRLREAGSETTVARLAFVGLTTDLLQSLDRPTRQSSRELAQRAGTDLEYTDRWLDGAYAFELVDSEETGYELTELGEAFLPTVPGTMMPMAIQSVLSARLADRLSELVVSGDQPGEGLVSEFENVAPWFGRMLEAKFRPYFEENVCSELAFLEGTEAGRVLDLGCGNGWYLRALLRAYDGLTGLGVDAMEESIDDARRSVSDGDLEDRLSFRRADIFEFRPGSRFDLVVLNRTLHHVWGRRDEVFDTIDACLADDGRVVLWEPAWPDQREGLRAPGRQMLGMRNLAEHAMGNRLLVPDEMARVLAERGFETDVRRLDDVETLLIGRPRGD